MDIEKYLIQKSDCVVNAIKKMDLNKSGFVIVVDEKEHLCGVLTDGDFRRAFIDNKIDSLEEIYNKDVEVLSIGNDVEDVIELFKNEKIKFVPIIDDNSRVVNVIKKSQLHAMLLQDMHVSWDYDFSELDDMVVDYEIFKRPWGFYKTTLMTEFFQSKIISINPGAKLSLQYHKRREEHWIIANGKGKVIIEDSIKNIEVGDSVFIPKGCKHRIENVGVETLILVEVQIGDYFGEDDIVRIEDIYGRE